MVVDGGAISDRRSLYVDDRDNRSRDSEKMLDNIVHSTG